VNYFILHIVIAIANSRMSLPFTNDDVARSHHLNVQVYQARLRLRGYFCNLVNSTKNAAKLLYASVTSCIHGVFPFTFQYTPLSVCLSIVEHDLAHGKIYDQPKYRMHGKPHDPFGDV
jgi:hypothetical protein